MRRIQGKWGECPATWDDGVFGSDAGWLFWMPEVLRKVGGSPHCAKPALTDRAVEPSERFNTWGSLLPLLHFHLGWPRVDLGLANWALTGFDPMDDLTLGTIVELWGPGLTAYSYWYLFTSGYAQGSSESDEVRDQLRAGVSSVHFTHFTDGSDPMHLGGHFGTPSGLSAWTDIQDEAAEADDWCDVRSLSTGHVELVVPKYSGWYRILSEFGSQLGELPGGRSWRVDLTIAPIGFVGQFRRSRVSGRWFAGRHRTHELGIEA